ncbi:MAG: alcohol dehydrogenase catalytic domain-containing protein [Tetrasphaera sp.]
MDNAEPEPISWRYAVSMMRAIVYDRPFEFAVKQQPLPQPTPGEIRVKVTQAGVCGTDLHLHEGGFITSYPLTPGHETVGVVDALGDGVDGFHPGEQVVINPNMTCGRCRDCLSGRPLHCPRFGGFGTLKPGGFAEYLVVPAAQAFSAEGLDPDAAVLAEPGRVRGPRDRGSRPPAGDQRDRPRQRPHRPAAGAVACAFRPRQRHRGLDRAPAT